jgi:hypothetical protein
VSRTPDTAEVRKGLKKGDRVIVRGQNGLPDGAAVTIGHEPRRSRRSLRPPSSWRSPCWRVPDSSRVRDCRAASILASSSSCRHHRAQRHVARPSHDALGHQAARAGGDGGARNCCAWSTTFRGATEISAQFEPSSDMVVALQQVQARSTMPVRRCLRLPT